MRAHGIHRWRGRWSTSFTDACFSTYRARDPRTAGSQPNGSSAAHNGASAHRNAGGSSSASNPTAAASRPSPGRLTWLDRPGTKPRFNAFAAFFASSIAVRESGAPAMTRTAPRPSPLSFDVSACMLYSSPSQSVRRSDSIQPSRRTFSTSTVSSPGSTRGRS